MTINTDISNPNLTKFAKYMFYIEQGMYFPLALQEAFQKLEPTLSETFEPINIYIDDENSKDYSIREELLSDNPFYLYLICSDSVLFLFRIPVFRIPETHGFKKIAKI